MYNDEEHASGESLMPDSIPFERAEALFVEPEKMQSYTADELAEHLESFCGLEPIAGPGGNYTHSANIISRDGAALFVALMLPNRYIIQHYAADVTPQTESEYESTIAIVYCAISNVLNSFMITTPDFRRWAYTLYRTDERIRQMVDEKIELSVAGQPDTEDDVRSRVRMVLEGKDPTSSEEE